MNSRQKGARGEREGAVAWAQAVGGTARRGQQFAGSPDSPDIVSSCENLHLECKRVERGNPYTWIDQAVRDAGRRIPVVLHKRNRRDWLVIVRLADVAGLAKEIGAQAEALGGGAISGGVSDPRVPAATVQNVGASGLL